MTGRIRDVKITPTLCMRKMTRSLPIAMSILGCHPCNLHGFDGIFFQYSQVQSQCITARTNLSYFLRGTCHDGRGTYGKQFATKFMAT